MSLLSQASPSPAVPSGRHMAATGRPAFTARSSGELRPLALRLPCPLLPTTCISAVALRVLECIPTPDTLGRESPQPPIFFERVFTLCKDYRYCGVQSEPLPPLYPMRRKKEGRRTPCLAGGPRGRSRGGSTQIPTGTLTCTTNGFRRCRFRNFLGFGRKKSDCICKETARA